MTCVCYIEYETVIRNTAIFNEAKCPVYLNFVEDVDVGNVRVTTNSFFTSRPFDLTCSRSTGTSSGHKWSKQFHDLI